MVHLKHEFQLKKVKFLHDAVEDFTHSHSVPIPILIAYRGLFALYSSSWFMYGIIVDKTFYQVKTLLKLTNWTYTCLIIYFTLAFMSTTLQYFKKIEQKNFIPSKVEDDDDDSHVQDTTKWIHKLQWFFYNIASTMSIGVTLYYWAFDYTGAGVSLSDLNVHILNSVFMLMEHILSSMPWRILHVVYPILFSTLYANVTVFYWIYVDPLPIYAVLDYTIRPGLAAVLVVGGMTLVLPAIQLMFYLVYRLRLYFIGKKFMVKNKLVGQGPGKVHFI